MNNQSDELAKGMTQSVTRRQALKEFSLGLAAMALAFASPALKADMLPANAAAITANAGNTFVLAPTLNPSVFTITATGIVQVSNLGNCTEQAVVQVQFPASPGQPILLSGSVTLTSADGATTLKFTVKGIATPDASNPAFFNNTYQATFTGGSGAFASATGTAEINELVMFNSPTTGTGTWTMKGHVVSVPSGP